MCCVWYFKLLPEVRFIRRNSTPQSVSAPTNPNYLVATIRIPVLKPNSEGKGPASLRCTVEILAQEEVLQSNYATLLTRSTLIGADGAPQAIIFSEELPEDFWILTYLDLNGNGKLDFDEEERATEPFRQIQNPAPTNVIEEQAPSEASTDLPLPVTNTQLIEIDFRPQQK